MAFVFFFILIIFRYFGGKFSSVSFPWTRDTHETDVDLEPLETEEPLRLEEVLLYGALYVLFFFFLLFVFQNYAFLHVDVYYRLL